MANVKIVRATYLVIDGTTYKLIDEDVPNWAKELLPDKTLKKEGSAADAAYCDVISASPATTCIRSSYPRRFMFFLETTFISSSASSVTICVSGPHISAKHIDEYPIAVPNSSMRFGFIILSMTSRNLSVSLSMIGTKSASACFLSSPS